MSNRRWSKFWWQDWMRDPALRSCCVAARGLWMDMLAIAHDGKPYGHVTINGRPATPKQIATISGVTEKHAASLLQELEEAGVFSRTHDGIIFSRRMLKDQEAAEHGREAISRRWGTSTKTKPDPNTTPNRGADSLEAEAEAEKKEPPLDTPPPAVTAPAAPSPDARKRGTRLPADWVPGAEDCQFARGLGLNPRAVGDQFRDFWVGRTGAIATKLDWPATWRNWCRREAERKPRDKPKFQNGFIGMLAEDRDSLPPEEENMFLRLPNVH